MKTPTLVDVAQRAGVSKSTVSLVNQDSPLVSPDTRLRVEAAARELGYVYNRAAALLRTPKSATIGLIIPNLRNNFFAEAVSGVEEYLSVGSTSESRTLFLSHHLEDPQKLSTAVRSMLESRVDGLIIVPTQRWPEQLDVRSLTDRTPTVFLSRKPPFQASYVGTDNVNAGKIAAEHLLSHGHKELILMGGSAGSSAFEERKIGIMAAIEAQSDQSVVFSEMQFTPSRLEGYRNMQQLMGSRSTLPAIVAYNDLVATGVLSAASELGLSAGRDFSVIGVDDIEETKFTNPPLTTVNTRPVEIGAQAAIELERLIQNNVEKRTSTLILPNKLIVRGSCGCNGGI